MDLWKALAGIIILLIGLYVTWHGYASVAQCNSIWGKISTFFNSVFGGSAAQSCYNSGLQEVGGIIVAIIGLVIIFVRNESKKSR